MEDLYDIGFRDALQENQNEELYAREPEYESGYDDGLEVTIPLAEKHAQEGSIPVTERLYIDFPSYKVRYRNKLRDRGVNIDEYEKGYKDGSLDRVATDNNESYMLGLRDGRYQYNQARSEGMIEGRAGYPIGPGHSDEFKIVFNNAASNRENASGKRKKYKKNKKSKKRKNKSKSKTKSKTKRKY
jgi:hypothetical protein